MIHSTPPNIEGRRIKEYHGVVTGEAIVGVNLLKDFCAGIRDIVGGRSAAYVNWAAVPGEPTLC